MMRKTTIAEESARGERASLATPDDIAKQAVRQRVPGDRPREIKKTRFWGEVETLTLPLSVSESQIIVSLGLRLLRGMTTTLKPYLACIRATLDAALCLRNFPSQTVERHK